MSRVSGLISVRRGMAATVNLSSPDRVLYPDDGITKGDLFEYYRAAAPTLVPHLRDRPFTMKRYPHGITGEVFFQKQAPKHLPEWIPTRQFRTWPREGGSRLVDFALVNTTEADGIHVVAPIARRASFEQTYAFAEKASRLLEQRHPGRVTTEWLKKKRRGVLVDHRQNGWGKTIASVYSVRPKPGAPVSTPLRWEELTADVRPRDFTMERALARIEAHGDLFAPVLGDPRPLSAAAKALDRLYD